MFADVTRHKYVWPERAYYELEMNCKQRNAKDGMLQNATECARFVNIISPTERNEMSSCIIMLEILVYRWK